MTDARPSLCAFLDPRLDRHGHMSCDRCKRHGDPWIFEDFCESPEGLEARADALVAYGESLPGGVTTEAFAGASLLRRKAVELRA